MLRSILILIAILLTLTACAAKQQEQPVVNTVGAVGVAGCVGYDTTPDGCSDQNTAVVPAPEAVKCTWYLKDIGTIVVDPRIWPHLAKHGGMLIPRWAADIECLDDSSHPVDVRIKYGLLPSATERQSRFKMTVYCCYCRDDGALIGGDGLPDPKVTCSNTPPSAKQ